MLMQRYKIQLENYQNQKNSILKQLAPIVTELKDIDSKISIETNARNQAWRELLRKNRLAGLGNPPPITNFQTEIAKCKTELDNLNTQLIQNELQQEELRRTNLESHSNGQNAINQEISIHAEEKTRISLKMNDINNHYVSQLVELIDLKSVNQDLITYSMKSLVQIESDIMNCKKTEQTNRGIILDILHGSNALRKKYRIKIAELNAEITQLNSEADDIAKQRNTIQDKYNHFTNLQSQSPEQYNDLTDQINDLQYKLDTFSRQLSRITNMQSVIQDEITALQSQLTTEINNLPIASDIMQPVHTPFKELISQKNTLNNTISQLQNHKVQLDEQFANASSSYKSAIQKLQDEDTRANQRIQIMIERSTNLYGQQNTLLTKQINTANEAYINLKRQIYLKKKELDNWNTAYKVECQFEYRKGILQTQRDKLQIVLDQVENDISRINTVINGTC